MTRPALVTVADRYWLASGLDPATPGAVGEAISWIEDVRVEDVPGLSVDRIQRWLDQHSYPVHLADRDRRLHGCAVATDGWGVIFIDAEDSEDERRFTIAHEVAHLLLDYFGPRTHGVELIGDLDGAVFDGRRPPTYEQQLIAAMHGESLQPFVHLLARDANLRASAVVTTRENLADELACELLVPTEEIRRRIKPEWDQAHITETLVSEWRIPTAPAHAHARRLARRFLPEPTFLSWLNS